MAHITKNQIRCGKRRHARVENQKGFTLIEVLVALAILSLSLTVLFTVFSGSLSRTEDADEAMKARHLAQRLLGEAESETPPKFGLSTGDEDGFFWTRDIKHFPQPHEDTATLHAATISVTVDWEHKKHSVTLQTLRLVPEASTP